MNFSVLLSSIIHPTWSPPEFSVAQACSWYKVSRKRLLRMEPIPSQKVHPDSHRPQPLSLCIDSQKQDSDVSIAGQGQDFSIFVDIDYAYGVGEVKLLGEELKQLLKGHTFHVNSRGFWVRRRFESDLTYDYYLPLLETIHSNFTQSQKSLLRKLLLITSAGKKLHFTRSYNHHRADKNS
jgi:hypothetical protein